ncbi:MAG TPA: choice-of-anchor tandem repeat GloVer-containing protein [Candidatus Solibacter sp.]|nr:choice-of-anchor tandem repeat GloVer-containing protein [Candidatus Solibacter sp.]
MASNRFSIFFSTFKFSSFNFSFCKFSIGKQLVAIFVLMLMVAASASAGETILHNFNAGDGSYPYGGLVADSAGNLYGTTTMGGVYYEGTVFELLPKPKGGWAEKVIYSFNSNGIDGTQPSCSLVFDKAGNLYGTTNSGGKYGMGTVFELTPRVGRSWKETILYNFRSPRDGQAPVGGVVFDASGNLYGTTTKGGLHSHGIVFQLKPTAKGPWTETILHDFNSLDGNRPYAALIIDASGNLYGTTELGGDNDEGTLFEVSPQGAGQWNESVLYNFDDGNSVGAYPYASLILDKAGNLYGTTWGTLNNSGSAFQLSPQGGGQWTVTALPGGGNTNGGVVMDAAGNLYGTVNGGIDGWPIGWVFELSPKQGGGWVNTVLHEFSQDGRDGYNPLSNLILDKANNVYGVTYQGGSNDTGIVFKITH